MSRALNTSAEIHNYIPSTFPHPRTEVVKISKTITLILGLEESSCPGILNNMLSL